MRGIVAAVIGGMVMFVWGALAHVALPIGMMGMRTASQQDVALAAVQAAASGGAGVYTLPGMPPDAWNDPAQKAAFQDKYRHSAYAFVVYAPGGNAAAQDMGPNLGKQLASDTLAAALLAWLMSLGAFGFARRVVLAGAASVFAWLALSVPYWNWYQFPLDFTLGALFEQLPGWLLAGAAMAAWLGRGERRRF